MAQTDSNRDKRRGNSSLSSPLPPARHPAPPSGATKVAALDGESGIGFNELRQACEISALREDVARLTDEAQALCDHIESAVEQVRAKVAVLNAKELADPDVMAPLLQFAVGALVGIREQAREFDLRVGAPGDDERPGWSAGALWDAPPSSATPSPTPSAPAPSAVSPSPAPPPSLAAPSFTAPSFTAQAPSKTALLIPAAKQESASWLTPSQMAMDPTAPEKQKNAQAAPPTVPRPVPRPTAPKTSTVLEGGCAKASAGKTTGGGVDWLSPIRR